jgi:hypothetical protein
MKSRIVVPDRAFVATITEANGQTFTTTIYGPNAYEAERRAATNGRRVVVRSELRK